MFDKNTKILVVDDFSTMRRIIKSLLQGLGFTNIHEANDGLTALPKIRSEQFDLVLTDWNMPGMDGLEMVKAIRADQDPLVANVPILMVTAETKREQIVAAAQAGINGYVVKPFTAVALSSKLELIDSRIKKTMHNT